MSTATTVHPDTVQEMLDREAVGTLVNRLGAILDEQAFDDLPEVFAEDAAVVTPGGRADGIDRIRAQAGRNHRPELRTQHLITNVVVQVDGDQATARANYVGVFAVGDGAPAAPGDPATNPAPQFRIGSVYRFDARRTPQGWRLTSMAMHPIWEVGERPI